MEEVPSEGKCASCGASNSKYRFDAAGFYCDKPSCEEVYFSAARVKWEEIAARQTAMVYLFVEKKIGEEFL